MRYLQLLLLCFYLLSCGSSGEAIQSTRSNSEEMTKRPYVVLVSMDGFRYDYLDKYNTPNIQAIGEAGIRAERMLPSFPSSTFPNHYTLATGLYPAHHGIVANSFYDPDREELYMVRDRSKVEDGTFYKGTPLWVLAEEANMLSASFFWVGSEADVRGIHPTYYYRYDGSIPNQQRVDQVLEWLALPEDKRPHMITLYFSDVDSKGHRYGPGSKATQEAVEELDGLIGQLDRRLRETGLPITLIITSDHGMKKVDQDNPILPERLVKLNGFDKIVKSSTLWTLHSKDSSLVDSTYSKLKAISHRSGYVDFEVFKTDSIPENFHYSPHDPRMGQILIVPKAPKVLGSWGIPIGIGHHGFNPYDCQDVNTIFLAKGPGLNNGVNIPAFENIHVYPLVAFQLGLKIPDNIDGQLAFWDSMKVFKLPPAERLINSSEYTNASIVR
ncbi:MAG: ectonucleotide pyrophosphatase/phosphodiesterase [Bacteroidota bacterium]